LANPAHGRGVFDVQEPFVLQRNPGPHALSVPSIPAEIQPGEVVDYPDLITGFEAADDETPAVEPGPDPVPAANPGAESGPAPTTRAGRKSPKTPETPEEA
jgi:hypothetical protein